MSIPLRGWWAGWSVSLRTYVIAVTVLALLPLLAHAVLVTWHAYASTRRWAERDLLNEAEHIARDIDARLDGPRAVMRVLAGSSAMGRGDYVSLARNVERVRATGFILGAALHADDGTLLMRVGQVADTPPPASPAGTHAVFYTSVADGEPILAAALPVPQRDAMLHFTVSPERLRAWLVTDATPYAVSVTDTAGREALYFGEPVQGLALVALPGSLETLAAMMPDWVSAEGRPYAVASTRTADSGLVVTIAQRLPRLYERVPFGPSAAIPFAVFAALVSFLLAGEGARRVHAAYHAALRGGTGGPPRIRDAARLGAELRRSRDSLLQAAGDIAVAEITRPPGKPWMAAEVIASPNLHALLGLPPGTPLTIDALARPLAAADRQALERAFLNNDGLAAAASRTVRLESDTFGPRWLSIVGILREEQPAIPAQLVLTLQDVTDRRETELEFVAQASRLRLATELVGLGIFEREADSACGYASDRLWEIMGLPPSGNLDFATYLDLVHPEDRPPLLAALLPGPAGRFPGPPGELRYRLVRPDGEIRHVRSSRTVVPGAEGTPQRIIGVLIDETEAVLAQRALAASEARLRLAVETAELGVSEFDTRTGRRLWSERLFRMCGLEPTPEGPPRERILALVHPQDHARVAAAIADQLARTDDRVTEYDFRILHPDRGERILSARSVTLRHPDGTATLLAVNRDVTEARRAERALAESELRLRLATEATGIGIWDYDVATGHMVWSDRMWTLRGLAPHGNSAPRAVLLAQAVPEDRDVLHRAWAAVDQGAERLTYEYRIALPGGQVRTLHSEGHGLRGPDGAVTRVVGVLRDVTAERAAARELRDRTATLELALDAAHLGVWVRDIGQETCSATPRACELFGFAGHSGPVTADMVRRAIHPDDVARALGGWPPRPGDPLSRAQEFRTVAADGTLRHILSHRATLLDSAGMPTRVIGVISDVTEARLASERLAASEERLRLAVEAAELGIFDYDPETREGHWSDRTWHMRGLQPRPGIPSLEEVAATLHPEDRAPAAAKASAQFTAPDGTRIENEFRVVWPDGTVRHLQMHCLVKRDATGRARVFGVNMDVTERRRAALELATSEARLRLAVDTAGMGYFHYDPETRDGYWSDGIWHMRGLAPQPGNLPFSQAIALVHPDDRDRVTASMQHQFGLDDGGHSEFDFRIVRPDGSVRHIHSRAITQRTPGGTRRIFGINLDITERELAAQALRESEARFRLASQVADLGVFQVNIPERTGLWSDRMWQIRGLSPRPGVPSVDEIVSTLHPEDRERLRAQIAARGRRPLDDIEHAEFRILRPDGAIRHIEEHLVALPGPAAGRWTLVGVNADVTEQRERELLLRASEEVFRMGAEAAGQGVWNHDLASGVLTWTPRLWRIHGLVPAEGAPPWRQRLALLHPEDRAGVLALRHELEAAPPNAVAKRTYRIIRPDGAVRTMERQALLVRNAHGQPTRIIGVVTDVTEARELQAQAMMADKLSTLGEMAGAIAHELAQPLQAVMASAATARIELDHTTNPEVIAKVHDRLAWIERHAARAGRTIQHLLAFSRGESRESVTHIPAAVEGAIELVGHGLQRAGIRVVTDLPDDLPPVRGGQIEIEQVLVNLLTNARDAIGTRDLRHIDITARWTEEAVTVAVTDTGGGVPPGNLQRVFEPFFTTKPVGKGTGIGLSVARRIMEALGGGIAVANTDTGARFTLTFPSVGAEA